MKTFAYVVLVETDSQDHANEVMGNRLGVDEWYGFDYWVHYGTGLEVPGVD